jgi:hypothetical protein
MDMEYRNKFITFALLSNLSPIEDLEIILLMDLKRIEEQFESMADNRKTYAVEYMERVWDQDSELWLNNFEQLTLNAETEEGLKNGVMAHVNQKDGHEFLEFVYVVPIEVED